MFLKWLRLGQIVMINSLLKVTIMVWLTFSEIFIWFMTKITLGTWLLLTLDDWLAQHQKTKLIGNYEIDIQITHKTININI